MAWRVIATMLTVIFAVVIAQSALAGPLVQITDGFAESGDYDDNGYFDGEQIINDTLQSWFNGGLIVIFGIILWGAQRVVRRELTRGGGGGF